MTGIFGGGGSGGGGGGGALTLIEKISVNSDGGQIHFQSIPQSYSAMELVYQLRGFQDGSFDTIEAIVNADTGAHYWRNFYVEESKPELDWADVEPSTPSTFLYLGEVPLNNAWAGECSVGHFIFPGYNLAAFNKGYNGRFSFGDVINAATTSLRTLGGGWLDQTTGLSDLNLLTSSGIGYVAGSWAALYGRS